MAHMFVLEWAFVLLWSFTKNAPLEGKGVLMQLIKVKVVPGKGIYAVGLIT